jgi:hypothetical protein
VTLTHDVEVEVVALSVALGIVAYTGVIASAVSTYTLQHQTLIADDNSPSHVVVEQMALQQTKLEFRYCNYRVSSITSERGLRPQKVIKERID